MPRTRSFRVSSFKVPKFKWFKQRCHSHDLFFEALHNKQIGENCIMSSTEMVYRLVQRLPLRRSTPSNSLTKCVRFLKSNFKIEITNLTNRKHIVPKSFHVVYPGNYTVTKDIISITHNCPKMVVPNLTVPITLFTKFMSRERSQVICNEQPESKCQGTIGTTCI